MFQTLPSASTMHYHSFQRGACTSLTVDNSELGASRRGCKHLRLFPLSALKAAQYPSSHDQR